MTGPLSKNQYDFNADDAPGQSFKPGLYVVATPIGNLRDITLRALDVLNAAKVIYCEDTRVSQKLLSAYGIHAKLERCDEHTEDKRAVQIIQQIKDGKVIALISDAGTPGISDPGSKLVAALRVANTNIVAIPGPSAVISALSASGIEGAFLFLGFLPVKSGARRKVLQEYKDLNAVIALYEAPQRVSELLADIAAILGERQVTIARELTKRFERFYVGTPETLQSQIDHDDFKGEVVVLIHYGVTESLWSEDKIDKALQSALKKSSLKQAVADVTAASGLPRKVVYARALALQGE
jgi:16S rRNA (cytidine1402-2'-O)-methyltransferase